MHRVFPPAYVRKTRQATIPILSQRSQVAGFSEEAAVAGGLDGS